MYHWITDKEFLGNVRRVCSDVVNRLVQNINKGDYLKVEMQMVGSGAKNIETQNGNEPIDLDYNICIIECNDDINDCQKIKEYVRKEFNKALASIGWVDCEDSSAVLTSDKRRFTQGNDTPFSVDVAIVYRYENTWYRLIHEKTGWISQDRWFWNPAPNSEGLANKVAWLKKKGRWNETRENYLNRKNFYLRKNDHNHNSFNCYIESVNEVYSQYRKYGLPEEKRWNSKS